MAHPLPQALFQFHSTRLARPVGAQRLAEFRDHRLFSCSHILDRVEIWQLAGGVGVGIRQSGRDSNIAPTLPPNFASAIVTTQNRSRQPPLRLKDWLKFA